MPTESTAYSQVLGAEIDADSSSMQSILNLLPEAVRDAVKEHFQSRQAVSHPYFLPCRVHLYVMSTLLVAVLVLTYWFY